MNRCPDRNAALSHLLTAHDVAEELGRKPWDYACQLDLMLSQGDSETLLRRLLDEGLVEHRFEDTKRASRRRTFRIAKTGHFLPSSCFVLTPQGFSMARRLCDADSGSSAMARCTPRYDAQRRILLVRAFVVKRFKVPAVNQELLVTAFEEDGWPAHLDDPLPRSLEIDSKKRLHDAIYRLNTNQINRLVKFEGDGRGEGVCWRLVDPDRRLGLSID